MSVEEMKEMLEYLRGQETKLQAAYTEACKGLTLLNSGAVAAMLAMVQALIGKGAFAPFKLYSVGALTLFLAGAVSASIVFFCMVYRISGSAIPRPEGDHSFAWATKVLIFSMCCFVVGAAAIILGILIAL